jgi:hypothetical protein
MKSPSGVSGQLLPGPARRVTSWWGTAFRDGPGVVTGPGRARRRPQPRTRPDASRWCNAMARSWTWMATPVFSAERSPGLRLALHRLRREHSQGPVDRLA